MRENLKSFYRFLMCLLPAALLLFSAGICAAADMVYALTVPYPTVSDGIALSVLKDFYTLVAAPGDFSNLFRVIFNPIFAKRKWIYIIISHLPIYFI